MMKYVRVTSEKCSGAFTLSELVMYWAKIMQESNQFAMALSDGNTCSLADVENIVLEELERLFPFISVFLKDKIALLHCANWTFGSCIVEIIIS